MQGAGDAGGLRRRPAALMLAAVTLAAALGGWWLWSRQRAAPPVTSQPAPVPEVGVAAPAVPAGALPSAGRPATPVAREVAPSVPPPPSAARGMPPQEGSASAPEPTAELPPLEESDPVVLAATRPLAQRATAGRPGEPAFDELVVPASVVRHFVVTVDNLTQSRIPVRYRFLRPPRGLFLAREIGDQRYRVDPANARRYEPFVSLLEGLDLDAMVALYRRFYPLFQTAWEQLGYPDRQFNDRLVEVIDHLLTAPQVEGPLELVRPKVLYQYADPELEALSSGRKLMLRLGPDNARRVWAVLARLRARLAAADLPPAGGGR